MNIYKNNNIIFKKFLLLFFTLLLLFSLTNLTHLNHSTNNADLNQKQTNSQIMEGIKTTPVIKDPRYSLNAGPDLVVDSITPQSSVLEYKEIYPYESWVSFTIKNIGTQSLNDSFIIAELESVTRDGETHFIGGYFNITNNPPLNPGETVSHSFAVGYSSLWPVGFYSIQIRVDPWNDIIESDETNNLSPFASFFIGNPGADLVVSDISIPRTAILFGDTPWTYVTFSVRNMGIYPINSSGIQADLVNVTKDGLTYNPGGFFGLAFPVPFYPGDEVAYSFAVGHDSAWPVADYSITVRADSSNLVNESDENNNFSPELRFSVIDKYQGGPLYINDDSDFTKLGFPGLGTIEDPYRLEYLSIVDNSAPLVQVINTTKYFEISYSNLDGIDGSYVGVYLENVKNGAISFSNISNAFRGIHTSNSESITIQSNRIFDNFAEGIFFENTQFSYIGGNVIFENGYGSIVRLSIAGLNSFASLSGVLGSGIFLDPSPNNVIEDNDVYNNNGNGVELFESDYNQIKGNKLNSNGYNGIAVVNSSYSLFDGNLITGNGQNVLVGTASTEGLVGLLGSGIFLDPGTDNQVSNNLLEGNAEMGIYLYISEFTSILDNEINSNSLDGIFVQDSSNFEITGNIVGGNGYGGTLGIASTTGVLGSGIFLDPSNNGVVHDNEIFENALDGVHLFETSNVDVSYNNIRANGQHGLFFEDSSYNQITQNTIFNNGFTAGLASTDGVTGVLGSGIFLDPSIGNHVSDNTIYGNAKSGVHLYLTDDSEIVDNVIFENGENGIFLQNSNGNLVGGNSVKRNGLTPQLASTNEISGLLGSGIFLDPSGNNTIENNFLEGNIYGLYFESSSDNDIYANIMMNNVLYGSFFDLNSNNNSAYLNDYIRNNPNGVSQAYDDGLENDFLGNFWSDHEDPTVPYKIDGKAGNEDPEPASTPNQPLLSDPTVLYPNGGEELSGTIVVSWEQVDKAFEDIKVTYSVYLSSGNNGWKLLKDGLVGNFFEWDTTKVDNGEYKLKIVAKANGEMTFDISDNSFKINNEDVSSSQTITTTPGMTIIGILGFVVVGILYLRKRK